MLHYASKHGALHNEDCRVVMQHMRPGSVDLTITSPPYDNLRHYKGVGDKWGFEVFQEVAALLYDVTCPGGVMVWVVCDATVSGSETGTSFKQALHFMKCGFRLHDTMIYKSDKPPLTHNRYEQAFEYMFVFSKGRPKTWSPLKIPCKHAGAPARSGGRPLRQDGDALGARWKRAHISETKIKNNVWEYATGRGGTTNDAIAFEHPAVFPEQLAADHILSWSSPGDLVFDPFAGGGTVPKMAQVVGRKWIAAEVVVEYCDIVVERVSI